MAKFIFELQSVLDARKFEQSQAENELGKAVQAEKEIQDKIDCLAQQKIASRKLVKGSSDFSQISAAASFSEFVRKQTEFLLEEMAKAKIISEEKREILKKAMQKVDALEKLKEEQLNDFKLNEKRKLNKVINGIVTAKYAREHKEKD